MSDEAYPLQGIDRDEELLSFSGSAEEQACIGHLRGDFGGGTEFWTTWWDHHEELKGQAFKDELDTVVNALRKDGPLKDLSSMERFCRSHPQARMSPKAGAYYRAKAEMARRASKRKVMQKTGKTEQGKYSSKYALTELLICGKCGTPYKRCTWAKNGKKRIVWRCVSRLEFGTKYCHDSPSLDEDRLHRAVVAALNEYGAIRDEVKAGVLELAGMAQSHSEKGGMSLLELKERLNALTAEQAILLDKILESTDDSELNAQLEMVTAEKQDILDRMQALEKDESQRDLRASRQREMEEWLERQELRFTEYEDSVTRRFVERITVMDAETIQVKIRDVDVVIDGTLL